jgi:hypothetical protein
VGMTVGRGDTFDHRTGELVFSLLALVGQIGIGHRLFQDPRVTERRDDEITRGS